MDTTGWKLTYNRRSVDAKSRRIPNLICESGNAVTMVPATVSVCNARRNFVNPLRRSRTSRDCFARNLRPRPHVTHVRVRHAYLLIAAIASRRIIRQRDKCNGGDRRIHLNLHMSHPINGKTSHEYEYAYSCICLLTSVCVCLLRNASRKTLQRRCNRRQMRMQRYRKRDRTTTGERQTKRKMIRRITLGEAELSGETVNPLKRHRARED